MSALIQSSDIYLIEVTQFASGIHLSLHDALDNTQYINNLFIGYSRCYNAWLSDHIVCIWEKVPYVFVRIRC